MAKVLHPKKLGPYIMQDEIGHGSYSSVVKAVRIDGEIYSACKIISKKMLNQTINPEQVEKEVHVLHQIQHKRVIKLVDLMQDTINFYLFLEYCPGGNMASKIIKNGKIPENQAKRYFFQLMQGIDFIHDNKVAHRDIKLENVLLDSKDNVKIADFGFSRFIEPGTLSSTMCGTPAYAAPEIYCSNTYDPMSSDIWSCGVVLYTMITGHLPWHGHNQLSIMDQIMNGHFFFPTYISHPLADLITQMMNKDPSQRLTSKDILNHHWFKDFTDNQDEYSEIIAIDEQRIEECLTFENKLVFPSMLQNMFDDKKNGKIIVPILNAFTRRKSVDPAGIGAHSQLRINFHKTKSSDIAHATRRGSIAGVQIKTLQKNPTITC